MRTFRISDDLVVEIHPGGEGDRPLVKVRSLMMQQDGDGDAAGVVVVYPDELDALITALTEAAVSLASEE